ncbi:MAG: KEOPS complex subunit Cgi121 [Candidatus Bathyarchaeota archaeon]
MLKKIQGFGKYAAIVGFKNTVMNDVEGFLHKIRNLMPSCVILQFFDARRIATWEHIYFAVLNGMTAFRNEKNISRDLAIESMLYVSAQHQINKATKLFGVTVNSKEIAVLIVGTTLHSIESALSLFTEKIKADRDDKVLRLSKRKVTEIRKIYQPSDAELKAAIKNGEFERGLIDLIIERMALLAIKK